MHDNGTAEFRALLTVPFNLWLVERALSSGAGAAEFSRVTSEVHLLELYWNYRVRHGATGPTKEYLVKRAATEMVDSHTLTAARDRVYTPETRDAWDALLSDEVLTENTVSAPTVSFTHNILFDFAVSVHLLEEQPEKIVEFVAKEPARPLFLRPSLVYHYTWLWHFKRETFWTNFWSVIQSDEANLRQIVRLVLPAVVVRGERRQGPETAARPPCTTRTNRRWTRSPSSCSVPGAQNQADFALVGLLRRPGLQARPPVCLGLRHDREYLA